MVVEIQRLGRARSAVRPGETIKNTLMGKIPLVTYEGEKIVNEACIADLHNTYKTLARLENRSRDKKKKLRVMTYDSFCHTFKFARYLKLVEFVREEPMIFPPPHGHLYQVGKHDGVHVRISKRRVFKLTDLGIQDERAWTDLTTAYKEGWELPQKILYIEPYKPPPIPEEEKITIPRKKPARREPIELVPDEFPERPPIEVWAKIPSIQEYTKLVNHLKTMQGIGIGKVDVQTEFKGLSVVVGDWTAYITSRKIEAEKRRDLEMFWRLKKEEELLYSLFDALEGRESGEAVKILGTLIRERSKYSEPVPVESVPAEPLEPEVELEDEELTLYKEKAQVVIVDIKDAVDETKKSDTIRRIKRIIDKIESEIIDNELITGLDELSEAIEEYEGISREGLSPEEYSEEKEAAFETIVDAVGELEVT